MNYRYLKNLLTALFICLALAACKKDNTEETPDLCAGVTCVNGQCDTASGGCLCDMGYRKDQNGQCTREFRTRFLGTWRGIHTDDLGNSYGPYNVVIEADPQQVLRVRVRNFMNFSCTPMSQPIDGYMAVAATFSEDESQDWIVDFTSLCPQPDAPFWSARGKLLDLNTLELTSLLQGTGSEIRGVYQRQ